MNAVVKPAPRLLLPLREDDLDAVLAIECATYEFPWTRGNFVDSLRAGYEMRALVTPDRGLCGYFIAMRGVGELHLLNLSIAPAAQRQGHARYMLDALQELARGWQAAQLWLEVRVSNARARALYGRYGFRDVGVRRGYYPARARAREDAVVMSLSIDGEDAAHGLG